MTDHQLWRGLSVIILCKDEALQLPECLRSLRDCAHVHVVDSGSSDDTVMLAEAAGAKVWLHEFRSFGDQRNWALDHCEPLGEWVLFLDADERSTPAFEVAVIDEIGNASSDIAGFYCCWKLLMDGRWLKRSDSFPRYQFRLLRKGRARFEDAGHGQREGLVQGRLDYIREPYLHEAFGKGWSDWFAKHNRYATQEAVSRSAKGISAAWTDFLRGSRAKRLSALKALMSRMPGWPLLRFMQSYVFKLGFLEGVPGLIHATNMGIYEYLIWLKMRELSRNGSVVLPTAGTSDGASALSNNSSRAES
jgi:glycosyltransferase involved in cell wall biosynthesis